MMVAIKRSTGLLFGHKFVINFVHLRRVLRFCIFDKVFESPVVVIWANIEWYVWESKLVVHYMFGISVFWLDEYLMTILNDFIGNKLLFEWLFRHILSESRLQRCVSMGTDQRCCAIAVITTLRSVSKSFLRMLTQKWFKSEPFQRFSDKS